MRSTDVCAIVFIVQLEYAVNLISAFFGRKAAYISSKRVYGGTCKQNDVTGFDSLKMKNAAHSILAETLQLNERSA